MTARFPVLVAEDEETDVLLLQHAIKMAGSPITLIIARDGQEVIDYLKKVETSRHDHDTEFPQPALLLLDLKMPRVTGFEVLAWIRKRPALRNTPTVVLTSSSDPEDRRRARELGAADFRVKSGSIHNLVKLVLELQCAWIQPIGTDPTNGEGGQQESG